MSQDPGYTGRRAMTPARKLRIWTREGGLCLCGAPVPLKGPGVTYDHDLQLWMTGPDEDANVFPRCDPCVRGKDARDASARGKVRRIKKKHDPDRLPKRGRRLQGAGFRKDLRRRMNGQVERAP